MPPDVRCLACGKRNPEDRARCRACGVRLPDPAAPEPLIPLRFVIRVVVVGGLLVVGLVVAAVVAYFRTDWQPYDSKERGFRVELPAPADPDFGRREPPLEPRPGVVDPRLEGTRLALRGREFGVATANIPPPEARVADEVIAREYASRMRDRSGAWRVVSDGAVAVNGFYAREVVLASDTRGVGVYRLVVAETRLYVASASGPTGGPEDPQFRRFLDSFEVTDPDLLAARARREERRLAKEAEAARTAAAQAAEAARREAEIARLGAERKQREAEEEEARRALEAAAFARAEAFRTAPSGRGPVPPATAVGRPVLYFPFDELDSKGWTLGAPGVGAFRHRAEMTGAAVLGPGVAGKAVYLPPIDPYLAENGPWVYGEHLPRAVADFDELTVAGWVRARGASVDLVRVKYRAVRQPVPTLFALGVTGDKVWAEIGTRAEPGKAGADEAGKLSAPWAADEAWHHLAMSTERSGERRRLRLYLDGREVAAGEFDHVPPGLRGTSGMRLGRATVIPGAGGHPEDPERLKLPVVGLDEVCLFDRPLSAADVRRLAGAAEGRTDP